MKISAMIGLQLATLMLAQCGGGGTGGGGKPVTTVTISASPTTVDSGTTSAITVTVVRNNQPAPGASLTYVVTGNCGTLNSMTGLTSAGATIGSTPGDATNTFNGSTFTNGSVATVTVTTQDGVSASCTITVNSAAVVVPVNNWTGVGPAPTVSILPNVTSVSPYNATYLVTVPSGDTFYGADITVSKPSNFSTGYTSTIKPDSKGQTNVLITESAGWNSDTVTIFSDAAKVGTSTWDVLVLQGGSGSNVWHATFTTLPGPK